MKSNSENNEVEFAGLQVISKAVLQVPRPMTVFSLLDPLIYPNRTPVELIYLPVYIQKATCPFQSFTWSQ